MAIEVGRLVYVGDPMCSWCWGFAPEIESLARDLPVEVVVGGLRPGPNARELDDGMALQLREHWEEIAEWTGQPFDVRFLDRRDGWKYDTEPAAIAVTEVRSRDQSSTLDYFSSVQNAFYAEGRDVTDFEVLSDLAEWVGLDRSSFMEEVRTSRAQKIAWEDFSRARNWGISGFPTLVGELDDGRLALLARGWTEADTIRMRIEQLEESG